MTARLALIAVAASQALAACGNLSGALAELNAKGESAPPPPVETAQADQTPLIAPGKAITLPRPGDLGRSVEVTQLVTLQFGGERLVFEARLSIKPDRIVLVGIDGMGRRAMTVVWNGEIMTVETAPWVPPAVRPASMLSDVILLYFPTAAVRQALAPAGCELSISARARIVRCGETHVLRAEYASKPSSPWNSNLRYANLAWGYEAEVRSVEVAP